MELDREQVLERFLLYSGEDGETASPERKALWEALCEGGAKWAEAQAGPGAAGWEESLVGLAAAQAFLPSGAGGRGPAAGKPLHPGGEAGLGRQGGKGPGPGPGAAAAVRAGAAGRGFLFWKGVRPWRAG